MTAINEKRNLVAKSVSESEAWRKRIRKKICVKIQSKAKKWRKAESEKRQLSMAVKSWLKENHPVACGSWRNEEERWRGIMKMLKKGNKYCGSSIERKREINEKKHRGALTRRQRKRAAISAKMARRARQWRRGSGESGMAAK